MLKDTLLRELGSAGFKAASFLNRVTNSTQQGDGLSGWLASFVRAIRKEGLSRVGVLPATKQATRRQYSTKFPWVQPSPIHFDGLSPTVLNVPEPEIREFLNVVVTRYVKTLRRFWMRAAVYAWQHPDLTPLDDYEFARLIYASPFSRFLNPQLDDSDLVRFGPIIEKKPNSQWFKVDLSVFTETAPLPGMYLAPSITLMEKRNDSSQPVPVALWINGNLLQPCDGDSWKLARYFVLQGAALGLVVGAHPNVHFPMDAINALSKSILPEEHLVRRLLQPHFYMQLPLNYAVLYIQRSVAHNQQDEIYTPFPCSKEGVFKIMQKFYRGIPGNSSYPSYRYPLAPTKIHSDYGVFLEAYYEAILEFVTELVAPLTQKDPDLRRWADEISAAVPGFPNADEIFSKDTLARSLTTFLWDVSVVHSADHWGYARHSINKVPLRMRVPPPDSRRQKREGSQPLVHWEDIFRHRVAWEMYFKPSTVQKLIDVKYQFTEPTQIQATSRFHSALRDIDKRMGFLGFVPLGDIASSIQY
jgi:hypothetical protein